MEIKLTIPDYDDKQGLAYYWEPGFEIEVIKFNNELLIKANRKGLISLAKQLLTLAQDCVPVNRHLHYDQHDCLKEGSLDLIIQKQ